MTTYKRMEGAWIFTYSVPSKNFTGTRVHFTLESAEQEQKRMAYEGVRFKFDDQVYIPEMSGITFQTDVEEEIEA